jgi:hypothetical protein
MTMGMIHLAKLPFTQASTTILHQLCNHRPLRLSNSPEWQLGRLILPLAMNVDAQILLS